MKNIMRGRKLFLLASLFLIACSSSGTKTCAYPGLIYGKTYSYIYEYDGQNQGGTFTPDINGEGEITNVPNEVDCADTGVGVLIQS